MKKSVSQNELITSASQEEISQRARELWEGYGRPTGRDKEIWCEAERQLLGVDPAVEGRAGIAVSAAQLDEATRLKKPITRLDKPKSKAKAPAMAHTVASKKPAKSATAKSAVTARTKAPAKAATAKPARAKR